MRREGRERERERESVSVCVCVYEIGVCVKTLYALGRERERE